MSISKEQRLQRSGFQFELIKLNLIINGGIVAFSIDSAGAWRHALLACPVVSLTLFSLWFHHALVIMIDEGVSPNSPSAGSPTLLQLLRMGSFAISMVANFVVLPIAAIFVYSFNSMSFINYVAWGMSALTLIMFFGWFYVQYLNRGAIDKFQ